MSTKEENDGIQIYRRTQGRIRPLYSRDLHNDTHDRQ